MKQLTSAAISAYSIAVAPESARTNPFRPGSAAPSSGVDTAKSVGSGAQRSTDIVEHRLQAVAGQLERGDDDDRDQGSDQPIFDRGRAEVGFEEFADLRHRYLFLCSPLRHVKTARRNPAILAHLRKIIHTSDTGFNGRPQASRLNSLLQRPLESAL